MCFAWNGGISQKGKRRTKKNGNRVFVAPPVWSQLMRPGKNTEMSEKSVIQENGSVIHAMVCVQRIAENSEY